MKFCFTRVSSKNQKYPAFWCISWNTRKFPSVLMVVRKLPLAPFYSHDVGDPPINVATVLGGYNVTILAVHIDSFQNDDIFQKETQGIVNAGGYGSRQFNATNYPGLYESGLNEFFQEILDKYYICPSTTTSTTVPHTNSLVIHDEEE